MLRRSVLGVVEFPCALEWLGYSIDLHLRAIGQQPSLVNQAYFAACVPAHLGVVSRGTEFDAQGDCPAVERKFGI